MNTIFSARPGMAAQIPDPAQLAIFQSAPAGVRLTDWGGFNEMWAIITDVRTDQGVRFSLTPSIGRDIYLFIFGNEAGEITISGMAFPTSCEAPTRTGLDEVLDYYRRNRVTARNTLMRVVIGSTSFEAFLYGASTGIADPALDMSQFSLRLRAVPEVDPAAGRAGTVDNGVDGGLTDRLVTGDFPRSRAA